MAHANSPIRAGVSVAAVLVGIIAFFSTTIPSSRIVAAIQNGGDFRVPQTTFFAQDFSGSTLISDYVSATPTNGQFNSIGSTGAGVMVSIQNGGLHYDRLAANSGSFSRTTDFAPAPTTLKYTFDLEVSNNSTTQTTAAVFQIGSGFATTNSAEALANVYARFGLNLSATAGSFSLRELGGPTNSPAFSGAQRIGWYMNNTGIGIDYSAPDGTVETLANDTADLWVGNTRVFNDYAVTTATQTPTDLKFVFTAGSAGIQIDNILIEDLLGPTVAGVSLSGHVTDSNGRGIRNATITITGNGLTEPREISTGSFGTFSIDGLSPGTYIVTVVAKRHMFATPMRVVTLTDSVTDCDFVADPFP